MISILNATYTRKYGIFKEIAIIINFYDNLPIVLNASLFTSQVHHIVDELWRKRAALHPRLEVDAAESVTDGVPCECLQSAQPLIFERVFDLAPKFFKLLRTSPVTIHECVCIQ